MRSIRHFRTGIGLAIVLTAGLAGQAWAASQIAYRLELGGNNFAEQWKAGSRVAYARGGSTDGQTFYKGHLLNYAVVVEASGIHSQPGHSSDNKEIYGAANLVFNVEFLDANDQPIGDVIFRSTINDGWDGEDPQVAAFALGYTNLGVPGRLIDSTTYGGPRLQPIFTYPNAPTGSGTWIGMGAGYKEWVRTGSTSLWTMPGVGMVTVPPPPAPAPQDRRDGMGIVPVAEGQIDVSNLVDGTYKLRVSAGNGNNVLRGDFDMKASTDRPAFAVAANGTTGHTITFNLNSVEPCTPGIVGRYVFYNKSVWDGNTAGYTANDWNAVATDKQPLFVGQTASLANIVSYPKGINGIMIDVCHMDPVNDPMFGIDIEVLMGNENAVVLGSGWDFAPEPTIEIHRGEGLNGADRVVMLWPDYPAPGSIPNSKWLKVGLYNWSAQIWPVPQDEFFFGLAIGNVDGNTVVNATDVSAIKFHYRGGSNPAPVDDVYDVNRDRLVNATDVSITKTKYTGGATALKPITPSYP